jgi:hypothetical protein
MVVISYQFDRSNIWHKGDCGGRWMDIINACCKGKKKVTMLRC